MTNPEFIDADASEAMAEAPPERTAVDTTSGAAVALPEQRSDVRVHHNGAHLIHGTDLPVVPMDREVAALAQMAVTIAGATTAPKALQGNPNDAFMILLTARDVGVGLTTAVREFHVIDGKVTLSPKVKLAMVKQQGAGKVYPHQPPRQVMHDGELVTITCPCGSDKPGNGDTSAMWHAERADEPGILHSSEFTMDMAARVSAREGGKTITLAQKSTWRQYPQRMLSWRALGYLLDDVFPEVGTGLYSPDEMGAVTDEDGVPVLDVVGTASPVRGTRAPAGHNAPPPPPAAQMDRDAIAERINELSKYEGARGALVALWTARREDGSPALPPLDRLLASQVAKATAMVASIEDRVKRGEFGTPQPADDAPSDAADDAGSTETADDAPEQPSDEHSAEPVDPTTHEAATAKAIATVQALVGRPPIVAALNARGLPTGGNLDTVRRRLAEALVAEYAAEMAADADGGES